MESCTQYFFVADSDAEAEEFIKQKSGAFDYYYEYLFSIFDKADFKGPFVINKNDDPSKLTLRCSEMHV